MILFGEDYYKYGAHIHTGTNNTSFLSMAIKLNKMGIKNNVFHLSIYNKDLINIDPHNLKDDSKELRFAIMEECKINPWYFFREVVRVPCSGSDPIPFILNRANLAAIWSFYNHIDFFLSMPRQCGKTIVAAAISTHILYIQTKNSKMIMLTKDSGLVGSNVARLKEIRDALPSYMVLKSPKDTENKYGLRYDKNNTEYLTKVARTEPEAADKIGRGETVAVTHVDEAPYVKNIQITLDAMLSANDTAAAQARTLNLPCSNMYTSTAGDLDTEEGIYIYDMIKNAMLFNEKLYDCKDIHMLEKFLTRNSTNNMFYIIFSYLQLGKDYAWFKKVTAGKSQYSIEKDYLLIWKSGSSSSVIPSELLDKIKKSIQEPIIDITKEYLITNWYVPEEDRKYLKDTGIVLGCDASENIGRDFTSLYALNTEDMSTIFTCKANDINLIHIAMTIVDLLIEYPKMVFIPERNATGAMLIDMIILELNKRNINPFTRIYNTIVQNKDDLEYKSINIYSEDCSSGSIRKHFGFRTTNASSSRNLLYKTVLIKALELNHSRIYDRHLIDEISQLVIRNNRIDHAANKHDDLCFSFMLASYLVFFGKNLKYYGLNKNHFLTKVTNNGTLIDAHEKQKIEELTIKVAQLEKLIRSCPSNTLRQAYSREINNIKSFLPETPVDEKILISADKLKDDTTLTKETIQPETYAKIASHIRKFV